MIQKYKYHKNTFFLKNHSCQPLRNSPFACETIGENVYIVQKQQTVEGVEKVHKHIDFNRLCFVKQVGGGEMDW